jgi:hypothetical protein
MWTASIRIGKLVVLGLSLLVWTAAADAQIRSGSSGSMGGSSFGGGLGGSSLGGGTSFSGGGTSFSGGGNSFSGGGTSFSGGGTSFSGGGTSFSGGGSFGGLAGGSGGSFAGAYGGRSAGFSGSYQGVSATNAFSTYYANPMAAGMLNSRSATFGQPVFGNITTGTTSALGTSGLRPSSSFGGAIGTMNSAYSSSSQPARYVTSISLPYPRTAPSRLQVDLQGILQRSTALSASPGIRVVMQGPVAVLTGRADSEHDRELAEAMMRLRPGVYDVRNEVQVPAAAVGP